MKNLLTQVPEVTNNARTVTTNKLRVLRALCGDQGISQWDMAIRAGFVYNRYWRIEKGYAEPTAEERARIAAALGVEENQLGFPPDAASSEAVA